MQQPVRFISWLVLALSSFGAPAQTPAAPPPSPPQAEVLMLGVFHFSNPGMDLVRTPQIDVMLPPSQAYLEGFAQRLCAFKPTVILLEFDPKDEAEQHQRLADYRAGRRALKVNENEQIGFRVAKACGVQKVHGFDEQQVHWNAKPLFELIKKSMPDMQAGFNQLIADLQASEAQAHRELDLQRLLKRANDPQQDRLNKDLYLFTNAVGAGAGFEGADAAASWWHRNFRMYAHVQRYAQPGERVLVVAGQGHTAILRDLLAIDRQRQGRDIRSFL